MKYFIYKAIFILCIGLAIIAAQTFSNIYTNRLAAQEFSETFAKNCIPDAGGKALLVKNRAGKVTCEKHEILGYGQVPHSGSSSGVELAKKAPDKRHSRDSGNGEINSEPS